MTAISDLMLHQRPQVEYRCKDCGKVTVQAAGLDVRCTNHNKPKAMRQAPLSRGTLDSLSTRMA